jgi:hypothetical protein
MLLVKIMKVKGIMGGSSLRELPKLRDYKRRRQSSYDRTGGNDDGMPIKKGDTAVIGDIEGAGCITHIWTTIACEDKYHLRKILLRMFWDDEKEPSVLTPIGDFFGLGHAQYKNFVSLPLAMSPQDGKSMNCFFSMPFSNGARIEVVNECDYDIKELYFYIDYELYDELEEGLGRFHAQWRRENPTDGVHYSPGGPLSNYEYIFGGKNLTGEGNYVILEAEGKGHYVGCNLNIHNLRRSSMSVEGNWYGMGDDMIFIDGDELPTIYGTGTEDYFNTAWCPRETYFAPYHGLVLPGGYNWSGKISTYRFHIEDPVYFQKSIKVTIEHGNANRRSDDFSSTAYWYQTEPHKRFPKIMPVEQRLPRETP